MQHNDVNYNCVYRCGFKHTCVYYGDGKHVFRISMCVALLAMCLLSTAVLITFLYHKDDNHKCAYMAILIICVFGVAMLSTHVFHMAMSTTRVFTVMRFTTHVFTMAMFSMCVIRMAMLITNVCATQRC